MFIYVFLIWLVSVLVVMGFVHGATKKDNLKH